MKRAEEVADEFAGAGTVKDLTILGGDKDKIKKQIDEWIRVFRNTKPAPGTSGPLIPGDPERAAEAIRSKEGIPLLKPVVDDLLDIAKKTGIEFKSS